MGKMYLPDGDCDVCFSDLYHSHESEIYEADWWICKGCHTWYLVGPLEPEVKP